MSSFMSWMDNDPFAAVVVMVVFVLLLFIIFAVIDGVRAIAHRRRMFGPYDGGCEHSAYDDCPDCL